MGGVISLSEPLGGVTSLSEPHGRCNIIVRMGGVTSLSESLAENIVQGAMVKCRFAYTGSIGRMTVKSRVSDATLILYRVSELPQFCVLIILSIGRRGIFN